MARKILDLVLKRVWFDEILARRKTREYREMKPMWNQRLFRDGKPVHYDAVRFRQGYEKDSDRMLVEYRGVEIVPFSPDILAELRAVDETFARQAEQFLGQNIYAISLGEILETQLG